MFRYSKKPLTPQPPKTDNQTTKPLGTQGRLPQTITKQLKMLEILNRVTLLLGTKAVERIAASRVIIVGMGGVGSWCAESLVRSGVGHLTIVDSDSVCASNINRQLMATTKSIGRAKVDVLRERLLEINPDADIMAMQKVYCQEENEAFQLEDYDYIIDCIDSLKDKMALLLNATATDATVFSSMGAALKMDPTQVKVAELWKVRGCPLGAALRKKMKRARLKPAKPVMCVYSEELLENKGIGEVEREGNSNGTMSHITAIFGFTLAGLVMKDITAS